MTCPTLLASKALNRTLTLALLVLLAASSLGCGKRKVWKVTQYAHPNPLVEETYFATAPLDFSDLRVGKETEDHFVARKGDDFKERWMQDKEAMNALFAEQLTSHAAYAGIQISAAPSDASFVIRPSVTYLERGYFGGAFKRRAVLKAVVDITRADGTPVDQLVVTEVVSIPEEGHMNITAGDRMRRLAEKLGAHTAQYVHARVAGS